MLGILIMLAIDLVLFGLPGIAIFVVQVAWIPFWAAGVINGVGHYLGYRNFETEDASRNIIPIGILIGGEEFHNNHHAYGSSAKLANKWWELDIGWVYICTLEALGLASVKKVSPRVSFSARLERHRRRYFARGRAEPFPRAEALRPQSPVARSARRTGDHAGFTRRQLDRVRRLMIREDSDAQLRADPHTRQWLETALERNPKLRTVYQFMQQLRTLSGETTGKNEGDSSACKPGAPTPKPAAFARCANSRCSCRRTPRSRHNETARAERAGAVGLQTLAGDEIRGGVRCP